MKQIRMLMPEEREALEHVKELCAQLNTVKTDEKRLKEEIFKSAQTIGKDIRFDAIKEYTGSITQKYIVEAYQNHIPELMKEEEEP